MTTLTIHNPATGQVLTQLAADDAASVADKAQRARAAQPAWAATPLADRIDCIARFRTGVVRDLPMLAATMTAETGKPIAMSRNELNGLLGRLDFFMAQAGPAVAPETVWDEGGMVEQIVHTPLGLVANISAWNYPWFVGCNVIVPALLVGNCVLYKPSEFAALTGLEIVRLLHEAGVPGDVVIPLVGAGDVGAALLEQPIDGLFFTGSHATGVRIAQALAPRLVKLQLELGGKDPTYVCDDAPVQQAAESLADAHQLCASATRLRQLPMRFDSSSQSSSGVNRMVSSSRTNSPTGASRSSQSPIDAQNTRGRRPSLAVMVFAQSPGAFQCFSPKVRRSAPTPHSTFPPAKRLASRSA